MNNIQDFCSTNTDWLTDGFIGQFAETYFQYFAERKYEERTVRSYLSCLAHFSQWAKNKHLHLYQVNESIVAEFLDKHLPHCCCVKPVCRVRSDLRAALGHLLVILRANGLIEPPIISNKPVDIELRCYDDYMRDVQGLATSSRDIMLRIVGRLLRSHFWRITTGSDLSKPLITKMFHPKTIDYSALNHSFHYQNQHCSV